MEQDHLIDRIASARKGDVAAFGDLITHHAGPLVRFVQAIIGDEHHAEDVVQQTLLNAYSKLDQFDPARGAFSTWLYRIARNLALNHQRSRGRSPVRFATPLPDPAVTDSPDDRAVRREQFDQIDSALAQLPEKQRTAWFLSEVEQLSQAQIAAIEGIPEGTVKSRVSRATASLKKHLESRSGVER